MTQIKQTIKALREFSRSHPDLDTALAASWLAKEYWLILMELKTCTTE